MVQVRSHIIAALTALAAIALIGIAVFFSWFASASAASTYTVNYDACVYDVRTPFYSYSKIVKLSGGCKNGGSHLVPLDVCTMTNPRTNWKAIKNGIDQVQVDRLSHC